jgi:hypothetical protein
MGVFRQLSGERSDDLRPPSRSSLDDLRAILTAQLHAQHLKASRITVLHVLAIAGGLCWVLMTWPSALPPVLRLLALLAWPIGLLAALLFAILEWKWDIRLSRLTRK